MFFPKKSNILNTLAQHVAVMNEATQILTAIARDWNTLHSGCERIRQSVNDKLSEHASSKEQKKEILKDIPMARINVVIVCTPPRSCSKIGGKMNLSFRDAAN